MTNREFNDYIKSVYAKYPFINRSKNKTINEFVHVMRFEEKDYSFSFCEDGVVICIPSIKETFIPVKHLAHKIKKIEYDEDIEDGVTYGNITLHLF